MSDIDRANAIIMPLVQLYAAEHIPPGVQIQGIESHLDIITQSLVLSLRAYCMGDEGPREGQRYVWYRYKFPRYVPKWLRNRWRTKQVIDCSWQGRVIYPEARNIPDLGMGRRVVEFYQYGPTPPPEEATQ